VSRRTTAINSFDSPFGIGFATALTLYNIVTNNVANNTRVYTYTRGPKSTLCRPDFHCLWTVLLPVGTTRDMSGAVGNLNTAKRRPLRSTYFARSSFTTLLLLLLLLLLRTYAVVGYATYTLRRDNRRRDSNSKRRRVHINIMSEIQLS